MAGEDVVVTTGLDLAGLQRDFRRGIGLADQFVSDLQRALSSRDLIGDLTPAGRRAGASLARGLGGALTGIGADLARSLDLSTAIGLQGAQAGKEFTTALGVAIGGADDTLNRIAASVDLSSGGERAGTQFTAGIARVIAAEAPALRAAMGAALVPATVATDIGRLEGVVTGALARFPVVFQNTGAASGAALITGIAGELTGARQLLTSFSTETSRALTGALTIGDVSGSGEAAGRQLALAVASGVTAEAPRVRGAIATALVPTTLGPEVGRLVGVFAGAGDEIVGLLGAAGTTGGQALTRNLLAEVGRGAASLRQLTRGSEIGVVIDDAPIRSLLTSQQKLLTATTETTAAMRDLDAATAAIDPAGIKQATRATSDLASAQQEWLRQAEGASVSAQALWQRQREAAFQAGQQAQRNADQAQRAAQQEVQARAQVRAELTHDITALGQYGGQVDATSRRARQAWLAEAQAIRRQAVEVGVSAAEMKRLDAIIDETTKSFREQEAAARAVAAQIRNAGVAGSRFGPGVVDLSGFRRQADTATRAISSISFAGRSLTQITNRLGPALVGVGFGLEALARGGKTADAGLRTALRAVASFAAFFGPEGFIVAGVAAATAAIIDLFSRSRDEAKQTAEQMQRTIEDMVRNVDSIGLQKQLQQIQLGVPTRLEDGTVELRGGLVQLQKELAAAEAAQKRAFAGQGGSIFKTSQEVDRLTEEVAKQKKVYDSLVRTILTLQSAGNDPALRKPFTITAASGAKASEEALKRLKDEVDTLSTAYRQLAPNTALQEPIVQRLTDKHEQIVRLLGAQKDAASETAVAYREMLKQLNSIDAVLIESTRRSLPGGVVPESVSKPFTIAVTPQFDVGPSGTLRLPPNLKRIDLPVDVDAATLAESLRRAIAQVTTAQNAADFARLFGSQQEAEAATKGLKVETANLERVFRAAADTILQSAAADDVKRAKLDDLAEQARKFGIELMHSTSSMTAADRALSNIVTAGRGLENIAQMFDSIDQSAVRVAGSIFDALDALQQFNAAKKENDTLGQVSAGFSIASAGANIWSTLLTGLDRDRQERKRIAEEQNRIMRQNNEAMRDNALRLDGFTNSIGDVLNAAKALNPANAGKFFRDQEGVRVNRFDQIDAGLRFLGSSWGEVTRLARDAGIQLFDSAGRLIPGALDVLQKALEDTVKALTTFQNTLDDQSFIAQARRDILDQTDAASVARDWLGLVKDFAPELFDKFFAGADIATKEGRRRFEEGIRQVFGLAAANKLPPELLAAFGGVKEFVNFLLEGDHALDEFTDSVKQASAEAVNLVQGFRDFNLDRAVFNARQAPQTFATPVPVPHPTPIPVGGAPTVTTASVTFAPTIRIDGREKDAVQITTEVVTELRRRALASSNPDVKRTVNLLPA